ncbi:MAG: hypothetical protein ABIL09_01225 [Gemmatimonadota bacterium]
MRIASSEILLSAQHALAETHTRQESLVAGVSPGGPWEPSTLDDGTVRTREQEASQAGSNGPTLLDEYLEGRPLEQVQRDANAAAALDPDLARARRDAVRAARADGAAAPAAGLSPDLEALRQAAAALGRGGLQALADAFLGGRDATDLEALRRAAASGLSLPDVETLRQGLAALGTDGADLMARLFPGLASGDAVEGLASFETEASPKDRLKMQLIRAAVEAFSGRQLRLLEPGNLDLGGASAAPPAAAPAAPPAAGQDAPPDQSAAQPAPAFGLRYTYRETHYERETTTFQATGTVQTADGQEVAVDVSLTMGRQFASELRSDVAVGAALQDPLVVNFDGTAAELTERTYAFDVDTDGQAEQIHFVGPNSGFLAYDRNGNGTVDNGGELFGAATGQGFEELARFDEDGNRFIDEGDSVYAGLRIWQKDAGGNDQLLALGERGIGAIYLGHADTPFQVKDGANQLQGVVRSSGIYLKEGGGTGTVQQLDLVA